MSGFWDAANPLIREITWARNDLNRSLTTEMVGLKKGWSSWYMETVRHCTFQNRQRMIRYQKKLARLMKRHGIPAPDPVSLNERPRKCRKIGTRYPQKRTSETASTPNSTDST